MDESTSASDEFPAQGLQFDAANTSADLANTFADIADSQEIVVGESGRAIVLGAEEDDLESDGSGSPPPPPRSKGWLRGSSKGTKGFLALVVVLLLAFVAVLAVGVVQLSSSSSEDEAQTQVDENAATDPTPAAPVPTPATPSPIPASTPDLTTGIITVPISREVVDVALPPSLEAKVPDFSDGLTTEEEEDWKLIEGYIASAIYDSLSESLPEGYELAPIEVLQFDGYLTSDLRRRHLREDRRVQTDPGTTYTVIYASSVAVDCQISDCTVATDVVADVTDALAGAEYLMVTSSTGEPTASPAASTPAPVTPSPSLGAQPTAGPSKAPSAKPVTESPTLPVMLTEREDDCNEWAPCERCVGECNDDTECEEGLLCIQRRGFEFVPGCEGPGERGANYCYDPFAGGLTEEDLLTENEKECDKKDQCAKCHGDCEDEEGCEDGLFCFRRNEFELVPGCAGQGTFGTNYCFDPADLEKLWGDSRDEDDRRHS
ncbi:hypothetical protein ACHAXT_010136 [Thalassiosira profunda]